MDDSLGRSREATEKRVDHRTAGPVMGSELGTKVLELTRVIAPLAEYIDERLNGDAEPSPPKGVAEVLRQLRKETVALCAIVPWLDDVYAEREDRKERLGRAELARNRILRIGRHVRDVLALEGMLHSDDKKAEAVAQKFKKGGRRVKLDYSYLKSEWTNEQCARVGEWLSFVLDGAEFGITNDDWWRALDAAREELLRLHPVLLPLDHQPPDWKSWRTTYGRRLAQNFVRDWRPETRQAIEEAFTKPFRHADGVNALQRVPLVIDPVMVDLAERFAVQLMSSNKPGLNEAIVKNDVAVARATGAAPCWLTYNCDFRGRINAIQHLHYGREDHVRAMFRFANGLPLGEDGLGWLEVHVANCAGEDKISFNDRRAWVRENLDEVYQVARDPFGTFEFEIWGKHGFRYVAACRELVAALNNTHPETFVTHLPVSFDGTNNGSQHGSMLTLDLKSGRRVNLIPSGRPTDIYQEIADRARDAVRRDNDWRAPFWRNAFAELDRKKVKLRKLVKPAAMTLPYGASSGTTADSISAEYSEATGELPPEQPQCECKCEDWAKERFGCPKLSSHLATKVRRQQQNSCPAGRT